MVDFQYNKLTNLNDSSIRVAINKPNSIDVIVNLSSNLNELSYIMIKIGSWAPTISGASLRDKQTGDILNLNDWKQAGIGDRGGGSQYTDEPYIKDFLNKHLIDDGKGNLRAIINFTANITGSQDIINSVGWDYPFSLEGTEKAIFREVTIFQQIETGKVNILPVRGEDELVHILPINEPHVELIEKNPKKVIAALVIVISLIIYFFIKSKK